MIGGEHVASVAASEAGLGISLAFIAGAVNTGGFMLVGQYTSHMSGILSAMADAVVLQALGPALAGTLAVFAFLSGAALSAILINWGRRHPGQPPHALPLALEAVLLLVLGILGGAVQAEPVATLAVPLLCFLMGLQNATITKASGSRIRTTHMTGVVTDLGIELGKLAYRNRSPTGPGGHMVRADRAKLRLLCSILLAFILGGVGGALAFAKLGLASTVPLAVALLLLAGAIVRAERHIPRAA
ncbi:YoaK family protein [Roseomonas populi]|uniref:DUF1275 domain-containing protein n=1 Tax=Roseomonas populi TaxID=3121582 RepID=A0ABT1XC70_9PROT|nr:YoaK family protein [Roseomonas pecuniae]MCR0985732.1 DUF1275 domain-containing protein [Roseomonas pecuniae]